MSNSIIAKKEINSEPESFLTGFENELCILFADTNQGKSISAVQRGNSISKGEPIPGFKLEEDKQRVLYFDFELSTELLLKQLTLLSLKC